MLFGLYVIVNFEVIMARKIIQLFLVILFQLIISPLVFARTDKFISISDIHFDPFAGCEKLPYPCPIIEKLRSAKYQLWGQILSGNNNLIAYRKDTNYSLLKTTLLELQTIKKQENPRFVVILGDFLGHNYIDHYRKYSGDRSTDGYYLFVRKTFQFIAYELEKVFPDIDVYSVVGNNDSYQDDYILTPHGAFFHNIADIWVQLMKDRRSKKQFQNTFSIAGYYAVTLPGDKSKIIVLDTVLFSSLSQTNRVRDAAAKEQLVWLKDQLKMAEKNHQTILLAFHIPAGIDVFSTLRVFSLVHEFWQPEYTREFEELLNEYSKNIVGILSGHIHMDSFQLINIKRGNPLPVIFTSSISPVFGNNPAFKVFSYDAKTSRLENYDTYFYPLDKLNWQREYSFNRIYRSVCYHCDLVSELTQIINNREALENYKKYYAVGHDSQPITEKKSDFPYYLCSIFSITPKAYRACLRENKQ
jgi:predicted phosphodiesterase